MQEYVGNPGSLQMLISGWPDAIRSHICSANSVDRSVGRPLRLGAPETATACDSASMEAGFTLPAVACQVFISLVPTNSTPAVFDRRVGRVYRR